MMMKISVIFACLKLWAAACGLVTFVLLLHVTYEAPKHGTAGADLQNAGFAENQADHRPRVSESNYPFATHLFRRETDAFLYGVAAHMFPLAALLSSLSLAAPQIGEALARSLLEPVYHLAGGLLYIISAAGSIDEHTQRLAHDEKDDKQRVLKRKFLAAASLGIIAGVSHLAHALFGAYRAFIATDGLKRAGSTSSSASQTAGQRRNWPAVLLKLWPASCGLVTYGCILAAAELSVADFITGRTTEVHFFLQPDCCLLAIASIFTLGSWLLIGLSIASRTFGDLLPRTSWEAIFHALGAALYVSAAIWSLVSTGDLGQFDEYVTRQAKDKLIAGASFGILAGLGHLTYAVIEWKQSWEALSKLVGSRCGSGSSGPAGPSQPAEV